jgi:hypothetical protein
MKYVATVHNRPVYTFLSCRINRTHWAARGSVRPRACCTCRFLRHFVPQKPRLMGSLRSLQGKKSPVRRFLGVLSAKRNKLLGHSAMLHPHAIAPAQFASPWSLLRKTLIRVVKPSHTAGMVYDICPEIFVNII